MKSKREDFSICYDNIGHKIVACGGMDPFIQKMLDTIEVYDLKEYKWTIEGKLLQERLNPSILAINQRVYIFGGHAKNLCT